MSDVAGRAVHRVEQRTSLIERGLGGTYRIHQTRLLAADCLCGQLTCRADVAIGESQQFVGGGDIGGDRTQRGGPELVVQLD